MGHMAENDVMEQLKAQFARPLAPAAARRIVIWNDPAGEFEDTFDDLAQRGFDDAGAPERLMPAHDGFPRAVRFVKASEGAMFEAKRLISRGDVENDLLVYRQRARGDIEGDWLADVELYADHFQADALSLLADALNAADSADVREARSQFKTFFAAKDRVRRFSKCRPAPQTAAEVELGVLAALLDGAGPEDAADGYVVRGYLRALLRARDGEAQAAEPFEKCGATGALARCVKRITGFEGPLDGCDALAALASHVLLSAASLSLPADALSGLEGRISAQNAAFCMAVVKDWDRDARFSSEELYELCRLVEEECNLPERFARAPLASILECDVFPCVNEVILSGLLESIAQGADRVSDARAAVSRRRDLSWYTRVACYFDVLDAVAGMHAFWSAHAGGFHEALAVDAWRSYADDWSRMDSLYRSLHVAAGECRSKVNPRLDEPLDKALEWAEGLYREWFLAESNDCWTRAAQAQWRDPGWVEGVERQGDFYWEVLPRCQGSAKTAAVVVSDALRFEVGRELAAVLEREKGGVVKLSAMQATFPSITEFGMAALLPHKALSLDTQTASVLVDGLPTATTEQREAVLRTVKPRARALRAESYLDLSASERKQLLKEAGLVYLYHNSIDAAGEKTPTESTVFDACADAVRDLAALAKRVCLDAPGARVVVTADHGFLFTRRNLEECDRIGKADLPESELVSGKRHIVCTAEDADAFSAGASGEPFVRMGMSDVSGGAYAGFAPRRNVRIKRPGGTQRYVHGGASLQELCVPVVTFSRVGARSKGFEDVSRATLRVLSPERRITNTLCTVSLLQEQPAVGKVLPCEYELSITDSSGNEVSNVVKAHADKTSENPQDRVVKLRFSLTAPSYSAKEDYFLVARDRESGSIVWREPYRIEISFAAIDFGF